MPISRSKIISPALWVVGSLAVLWIYLQGCTAMWPVNKYWGEDETAKTFDQTYYIKTAWDISSGFANRPDYVPRSRMPLYPLVLCAFLDVQRPESEQFELYKRLNVALSCLALAGIAVVGIRRFGRVLGIAITLATAFTVFVFKAILIQPEITFYFLFFVLFLFMMDALKKPSWKGALWIGLLSGFAHMVKGSALPVFLLFWGFLSLKAGIEIWRNRRSAPKANRCRWMPLAAPCCYAAAFLSLTGVYMYRSWATYGSPLYSPHSKYYLWVDSAAEMFAIESLEVAEHKPLLHLRNIALPDVQHFLETKWLPDPARRSELLRLVNEQGHVELTGEWEILPTSKTWLAAHTWRQAVDQI